VTSHVEPEVSSLRAAGGCGAAAAFTQLSPLYINTHEKPGSRQESRSLNIDRIHKMALSQNKLMAKEFSRLGVTMKKKKE